MTETPASPLGPATALGAATQTGRREIAPRPLDTGARLDELAAATVGRVDVAELLESTPAAAP